MSLSICCEQHLLPLGSIYSLYASGVLLKIFFGLIPAFCRIFLFPRWRSAKIYVTVKNFIPILCHLQTCLGNILSFASIFHKAVLEVSLRLPPSPKMSVDTNAILAKFVLCWLEVGLTTVLNLYPFATFCELSATYNWTPTIYRQINFKTSRSHLCLAFKTCYPSCLGW